MMSSYQAPMSPPSNVLEQNIFCNECVYTNTVSHGRFQHFYYSINYPVSKAIVSWIVLRNNLRYFGIWLTLITQARDYCFWNKLLFKNVLRKMTMACRLEILSPMSYVKEIILFRLSKERTSQQIHSLEDGLAILNCVTILWRITCFWVGRDIFRLCSKQIRSKYEIHFNFLHIFCLLVYDPVLKTETVARMCLKASQVTT